MRTLYITEFISLDGVIEAPGGEEGYRHTGWTFDIDSDPAQAEYKTEETFGTQTLLLGRATYEGFAEAWPPRNGDFADKFNTMEKVVVSTTLADPTWTNTTVVRDLDAVRALKEGEGGPIGVHGSPTLARSLHRAGLVDEWHLMVFPVILGSGQRLFPTDVEDKQKLLLARDAHLHQRHPAQHLRRRPLTAGQARHSFRSSDHSSRSWTSSRTWNACLWTPSSVKPSRCGIARLGTLAGVHRHSRRRNPLSTNAQSTMASTVRVTIPWPRASLARNTPSSAVPAAALMAGNMVPPTSRSSSQTPKMRPLSAARPSARLVRNVLVRSADSKCSHGSHA